MTFIKFINPFQSFFRTAFAADWIDAHKGGEGEEGEGGAPHVPPIKIFENFHIKMQ